MKTKYYSLMLLGIIIFCAFDAQSQSIYFGVKAGVGIPNLSSGSNSEVSQGYSSRLGPYLGVFGDFHLNNKFSLQAEINYSSQGGKKNGRQAIPAHQLNPQIPEGTFYYANYDSKVKLNYIEVPLLAKFIFPLGSQLHFSIDIGPYAGFLVNATNATKGSSNIYADKEETQPLPIGMQSFDANTDIKNQLHKFNFGFQGGIALAFTMGNEDYLFLHAGGNYGIVNIQKFAEDGKNRTGAATVVLGYALKLN